MGYPRRRPRPVGHLLLPNQVTTIVLPAQMAVANLPLGCFSAASWHDLATFCDLVQLLAHAAGQEDVLALGQRVNETLLAIRARFDRLGRWGATGPEQIFLREAINPLDAFFRRQGTHQVRAALLRLDAAMKQADAAGAGDRPIVINPAQLPAAPIHP